MEPKHHQITPQGPYLMQDHIEDRDSPVVSAVSREVRVKGAEESSNGRV